MKKMECNTAAFFALLRAGLWEKDIWPSNFEGVDFKKVYLLAEEQSVTGLIAAGFDHVVDAQVPKEDILTFVGSALQLEQRNISMNRFIEIMNNKLNVVGVIPLLMKGQGIAQCYERPLWRSPGDVDYLLYEKGYEDADAYLKGIADNVQDENPYTKHKAMTIMPWDVEIHGTLRGGLVKWIDSELDVIQKDIFEKHKIRVWKNGETEVYLPAADEDVVYVFTHILQHFFMGGIGLRQICDWCRLLWKYRDSLNRELLESRIQKMELVSEWCVFGAFSVEYLGMPVEAMPLYSPSGRCSRKAKRIASIILESGNFGHNKDKSYYSRYPYLVVKAISLFRNTMESMKHFMIFPMDATRVWFLRLGKGLRVAAKGK